MESGAERREAEEQSGISRVAKGGRGGDAPCRYVVGLVTPLPLSLRAARRIGFIFFAGRHSPLYPSTCHKYARELGGRPGVSVRS